MGGETEERRVRRERHKWTIMETSAERGERPQVSLRGKVH